MARMIRLMVAATLLALAGCSAATTAQSVAPQAMFIEGVTIVGTDKTVGDHIVSFATNKNCSTVRKHLGKHYCEEDELGRVDEVYCYRTLGKVTCYAVPAPYGETDRVDHVSPGSPPPR